MRLMALLRMRSCYSLGRGFPVLNISLGSLVVQICAAGLRSFDQKGKTMVLAARKKVVTKTARSLSGLGIKRPVYIISLLSAMCLTGCQALDWKKGSSTALTPPQSVVNAPQTAKAQKPGDEPFHTVNTDQLNISDSIGIAIARHPTIGRAAAVVVQSNAQIAVEKSAWYPTLEYGVNPGYSRYYGSGSNNKKNDDGNSTVTGTIGASQLIYDFGRTSSRVGAAKATYEKDRHMLTSAVEEVAANMALVYIELAASQELIKAAEREYDAMKRTRDKIAERVGSGLSDAIDLNQADVSIQRSRSDLLSAQTRFDVAAGRFAEITGIRPRQVTSLDDTSKFIESLGQGFNTIENTPTVLAADADVKASLQRVKLARAQLYPSVNLGLSQQKATGQRNITNDSSFVGLKLSGSLNTGFREKHQIDAAQAELNAAKQTSENERLVARTSLGSAKTEADGATARMDNSRHLKSLSLTSRDLYWQQYTLNKRPLTDVVNAERDTFIAESEYITAMADHMSARVKAYTAVGELVDRIRSRQ